MTGGNPRAVLRLRTSGFARDFDGEIHRRQVIVGGHGAGKSTLLGALHFAAAGKDPQLGGRPGDVAKRSPRGECTIEVSELAERDGAGEVAPGRTTRVKLGQSKAAALALEGWAVTSLRVADAIATPETQRRFVSSLLGEPSEESRQDLADVLRQSFAGLPKPGGLPRPGDGSWAPEAITWGVVDAALQALEGHRRARQAKLRELSAERDAELGRKPSEWRPSAEEYAAALKRLAEASSAETLSQARAAFDRASAERLEAAAAIEALAANETSVRKAATEGTAKLRAAVEACHQAEEECAAIEDARAEESVEQREHAVEMAREKEQAAVAFAAALQVVSREAQGERCPTCQQELDAEGRRALERGAAEAQARVESARQHLLDAETQLAQARAQARARENERAQAQRRAQAARELVEQETAAQQWRETQLARMDLERTAAVARREAAQAALSRAADELHRLEAVKAASPEEIARWRTAVQSFEAHRDQGAKLKVLDERIEAEESDVAELQERARRLREARAEAANRLSSRLARELERALPEGWRCAIDLGVEAEAPILTMDPEGSPVRLEALSGGIRARLLAALAASALVRSPQPPERRMLLLDAEGLRADAACDLLSAIESADLGVVVCALNLTAEEDLKLCAQLVKHGVWSRHRMELQP